MIAFLLLLVVAESTRWYIGQPLKDEEAQNLKENKCFRGTYGPFSFSLLTCEVEGARFINELPDTTELCVVEFAQEDDLIRGMHVASRFADTTVFHTEQNSLILSRKENTGRGYPDSCHESHYERDLNMVFVPTIPILPVLPDEAPFKFVAPDARVERILSGINGDNLLKNMTDLASQTGTSGWTSRLSNLAQAQNAVNFWNTRLRNQNAGNYWTISQQSLNRAGYCNNTILTRAGTVYPNRHVVIGAHFDSRSTSTSNTTSPVQAAPGADDNGSGTVALSELSRLIAENGLRFQNTLTIVLFCGEEQGLYGSAVHAASLKNNPSITVVGMVNTDMMGYSGSTLAMGYNNRNADTAFTSECLDIGKSYFPNMRAPAVTSACCSDQQSYYNQGFKAAGFFETASTSVVYPQYHTSQDTPTNPNISWKQVADYTKFAYSCALEKAIPA